MRFRDLRVRSRDGSYLVYYDLQERVTEREMREIEPPRLDLCCIVASGAVGERELIWCGCSCVRDPVGPRERIDDYY